MLAKTEATTTTIYKLAERDVPDDVIERALDAARWAPNHKLTEPWRFVVVGPTTRAALGKVAERLALEKAGTMPPEERDRQVARAIEKVVKVPALVVIAVERSPSDAFREREDYAAACCAAQNFQLSLWADGVGCQWSTGGVTRDDESYRVLGIDKAALDIIGFFKVGYPLEVPRLSRRPLDEVRRRLP